MCVYIKSTAAKIPGLYIYINSRPSALFLFEKILTWQLSKQVSETNTNANADLFFTLL